MTMISLTCRCSCPKSDSSRVWFLLGLLLKNLKLSKLVHRRFRGNIYDIINLIFSNFQTKIKYWPTPAQCQIHGDNVRRVTRCNMISVNIALVKIPPKRKVIVTQGVSRLSLWWDLINKLLMHIIIICRTIQWKNLIALLFWSDKYCPGIVSREFVFPNFCQAWVQFATFLWFLSSIYHYYRLFIYHILYAQFSALLSLTPMTMEPMMRMQPRAIST